jgi:hypothetical protein
MSLPMTPRSAYHFGEQAIEERQGDEQEALYAGADYWGEDIPKREGVKTHKSLAGTMRRGGMNEPVILAALTAINQTQGSEPLPDPKLRTLQNHTGSMRREKLRARESHPLPRQLSLSRLESFNSSN